MEEHKLEFTKHPLNNDRKAIKMVVGLLIDHCKRNSYIHNICLAEDYICRFCQDEEETPVHVLCQCDGLARASFLALDLENLRANDYIKEALPRHN